MHHRTKFHANWSNCFRDMAILRIFKMAAVRHLGYACLDHPQRVFGGLYHFANFGYNSCSSFDNMQV